MTRSSRRFATIALCLSGITAILLDVPFSIARAAPDVSAVRQGASRRPAGVNDRLSRLRQAIPGNGGEFGPGFSDHKFWARAYPDADIPLERLTGARQAFEALQARGFGPGGAAGWEFLGPTTAAYQQTQFRFSYVPSQYEAAGRVTSMAIAPTCRSNDCRIWIAAAGGGVWRTDNALAGSPRWEYLSGSIGINAVGSIVLDPNDASGQTLWIGTGEANASADSAAGVGVYKSTDGGSTWAGPFGATQFSGRAAGSIAVHPTDPNTVYVATTRGVRGVASTGGATANIPGALPQGLWKTTDGGATWTFLHNGAPAASQCFPVITAACSGQGVRKVVLDPSNPAIVYAASYARGVWRSVDGGSTWEQIKPSLLSLDAAMRPEIAVTRLANGKTRMYVGEGSSGGVVLINGQPFPRHSRLFRSDDVASGVPTFVDLTSPDPAQPGFGSFDYCTGQCWYDNLVYTPPGHPDIVYVGGSYQYGEPAAISHGRALILSTDAGVSFTDMTKDTTGTFYPNGLHPDHHAVVVHPDNPFLFFSGSDGGVMRSSGDFRNASSECDWRGLNPVRLARCHQLLSRIPRRLDAMNRGLSTLQFQSLSVDPTNPHHVMGGTQDNGTFQTSGSTAYWKQTMWGDGGQSGFDASLNTFRFHTFFGATPDVNFESGAIHDWNWVADRLQLEPQLFYPSLISDPVVSGTMWAGLGHVWRTKTHGTGGLPLSEFRARCNEFSGDFTIYCGDFEPLGAHGYNPPAAPPAPPNPWVPPPNPDASTRLTASGALYGTDRAGGAVSIVSRGQDTATLWAATSAGRVFISKNAAADPASAVVFTRLDSTAANDPNRFVTSIFVDPDNANRAWISYNGFNAATPTLPGHVFEVVYNPGTGMATWTNRDGSGGGFIGDLPVTSVAYDKFTGDLYASTDFGVVRAAAGGSSWTLAAPGMPNVEVSALTLLADARRLYAATHGLSAWTLVLPE